MDKKEAQIGALERKDLPGNCQQSKLHAPCYIR